MNLQAFWHDVVAQNREMLPSYFCTDAIIRWHCTNEQFSVQEYVQANCEYPNEWNGEIERVEMLGSTIVLVGCVYPTDMSVSFHVVSFIRQDKGLIRELDEYWADDGEVPAWRKALNVGSPIKR